MKELKLSITHIKILETISLLNKNGLFPLSDGVYKIVSGVIDEETINYVDLSTFGTLVSFPSKKVCRYLLALQRHGYIKKIYSKKNDQLFYATTELGEDALVAFHKKHKKPFIKKKRTIKPTIVKF